MSNLTSSMVTNGRTTAIVSDDDEPDIDMPWFQPQTAARIPPPVIPISTQPGVLTLAETISYATELLQVLLADQQARSTYYNLSRSWHDNLARLDVGGGDFEAQWLAFLATTLTGSKRSALTANDFGNIHRWLFLALRRVFLAVTGHDPHPNPDEPLPLAVVQGAAPQAAQLASQPVSKPRVGRFRSFHWVPNDTSAALGTYQNQELGVPTDQA